MSPTKHTLKGSDDISAQDTSILTEALDQTEVLYPSAA